MSARSGDPPAKRRRLKKDDRRRQLLDVAEKLFVSQGYEATSIEDVARAAGVSRPILYEHHGSKEVLLLACCGRARRQFEERLEAELRRAPAGDPSALVRLGGEVFFGMLEDDPERWILLFSSTTAQSGELADGLARLRAGTIARIAGLLAENTPQADAAVLEICAYAISGIGEQMGRWWVAHPDADRNLLVDIYTGLIAGGLQAVTSIKREAR